MLVSKAVQKSLTILNKVSQLNLKVPINRYIHNSRSLLAPLDLLPTDIVLSNNIIIETPSIARNLEHAARIKNVYPSGSAYTLLLPSPRPITPIIPWSSPHLVIMSEHITTNSRSFGYSSQGIGLRRGIGINNSTTFVSSRPRMQVSNGPWWTPPPRVGPDLKYIAGRVGCTSGSVRGAQQGLFEYMTESHATRISKMHDMLFWCNTTPGSALGNFLLARVKAVYMIRGVINGIAVTGFIFKMGVTEHLQYINPNLSITKWLGR